MTNDAPAVNRLSGAPKLGAFVLSLTAIFVVWLAGTAAPASAHNRATPSGEPFLIFPFQPIGILAQPSVTDGARSARSASRSGARAVSSRIIGAAEVGRRLKVRVSSGSGERLAYQWERCRKSGGHCSKIRGATKNSYRVTRGDVGHVVTVSVKASAIGGPALVARSSVTVGAASTTSAPKNVAVPVLSGSGVAGTALTSTTGSWQPVPRRYLYAWFERASSTSAWQQIAGAGTSRYTIGSYPSGTQITVAVTGRNDAGSATAMAAPKTVTGNGSGSIPPPVLAPMNTVLPAVSGTAAVGNVLTTSSGSWSNNPTSYSYQWEDCNSSGGSCAAISGATSTNYTLTTTDENHTVSVVVTATNSGGSTPSSSAVTGVVPVPVAAPVNTAVPAVSGTAAVGNSLTASNGSWSNSPTGYSYKWQDCNSSGGSCTAISGATSSSYTVAAGDENDTIKVSVTASNSGGSASASSAATSVVAVPASAPSNTAAPAVSGAAAVGSSLSASNGSWSNGPTGYAYKWQDCNSSGGSCTSISGATSSSYTVTASDESDTIKVAVTASNSAGSASAMSPATSVVAVPVSAPTNTSVPTVSGTAAVGNTLTAGNGSWSNSPTSYSYKWQDCNSSGGSCTAISGATSSSYTVAAGDESNTIEVVVTASNSAGSASASSAATSLVAVPVSAPTNSSLPTISGTAAVGNALTAGNGSWSNSPTGYSYQWQDCNSSGASCANISGATSSSYTVATSDQNDTLKVVVTASNSAGSASASSGATTTVSAGSGGSGSGPQIYIANTAAGSGSGSSCANARAESWLQSTSNWGNSAGQVGPGVTVDLCGTISLSGGIWMENSGTSTNPITFYWEPGAMLTSADWNGGPAIDTNGQSYITFNGADNGTSIQATAEGSGLADQGVPSQGFYALNCTGCTFENLTIANLYQHTSPSDTSVDQTEDVGIEFSGSNVTVADNTIHDVGWALYSRWTTGEGSNAIYGNNIYNMDHGFAATATGTNIGPMYFYDNHVHDMANWDTVNDEYHHDGLHCYGPLGGPAPTYTGFYIYDNRFDGTVGQNVTAQIFMEGNSGASATPCSGAGSTIDIFNNVLTSSDYDTSNPYMSTSSIEGGVYNDTVIGASNTDNIGGCGEYADQQAGQTIAFENNILDNCDQLMGNGGNPDGTFRSGNPNYNLYADGGENSFACNGTFYDFQQLSAWQSCIGADAQSVTTSNPKLNSDGSVQSGSPAIGIGSNLTSVCNSLPSSPVNVGAALCTTYTGPPAGGAAGSSTVGSPRPTAGAWNAGAY